jgi:competence protein ComEA
MRSRSLAAQHDAAVARRLELLTSELAAVRGEAATGASVTQPRAADPFAPRAHTRIRAVPDPEERFDVDGGRAEQGPAPAVVRLPGRHASRRRGTGWPGFVPDGLRGRVGLEPGQLAVVAVVAVLGLVLTCWWLVRSTGHDVTAPVALETPRGALVRPAGVAGDSSPDPTSGAPTEGHPKIVVDVTGRVRRPGIVVLRQGSRVVDALRAAGGARPGVDLSALNLARVLGDGEQIVVGQPATAAAPSAAGSSASVPGLVNINTADETALESLPEVGPVTAQAILAWRTQHGAFTSVDQLLDVDGIGDATLAKLTPYVTI